MPLYFAYGSNMDRGAMAKRCPASRALGPARLMRHRFFLMESGYASVRRDAAGMVHGLLWDVAFADIPALDAYEEVARGLFVKRVLPVLAAGGARRALVYVGASQVPGEPRPGYLEAVLAAASDLGLPAAYRREVAGWQAPPRGRRGAPLRHAAVVGR
jgi:AIG2-like family